MSGPHDPAANRDLTGSRLGPYEIRGRLGAGGMGDVYRARDSRLGRDVALKILPEAFASDPDRVRRFEKEARAASSLNHPNIVTVYEVGAAGSLSYIAMEVVEGITLREILAAGPLSPKRLLDLSCQISTGLAQAHGAGIVHRDLKPENIMVSKEGFAKILDFGLAKRKPLDRGASVSDATMSAMTETGFVAGTVGYMSPEQATGSSIDYRSDQFSFGSILYEMATGRRAFVRGSAPETLTAIIRDEPEPISALNPRLPPPVRWIIERCLAKEAQRRFASTEDLAGDLATIRDHLSETTSAVEAVPAAAASTRRRRWWIPAVIAAGILITAGVIAWHLRRIDYFWQNPLRAARFTRLTDWEGSEVDADISSDGKFVTFLSDRDGPFDAWATQVGSDEFLNLSRGKFPDLYLDRVRNVGFSGDDAHVWMRISSPDGKKEDSWLVPTMGGTPRPFLPNAAEVVWSPDRMRTLYHPSVPGDPIFVANRNGANSREIFIEKPGIHNHYPAWSPDGRFAYFVRGIPSPYDMDIWRMPSTGGTPERLTNFHSRVAYLAFLDERTLLYTAPRPDGSGSGLYAMDVDRRTPHALSFGLEEYASVAASADGRRLVVTVANPTSHLWMAPVSEHVVDDSGVGRFSLPAVRAAAPRFGPGYLLFLSSKGGVAGLWKFKDGSDTELWKGSEGSVAAAPAVSPDGSQICFVVRDGKQGRLHLMSADGTGARRLTESLDVRDAPCWSPDGKWVAVVASEGKEQPLFKIAVDGGAPVRLVGGVNYNPVWSPDGRFIAYSENHGGPKHQLKGVTPDKQPFRLPEVTVRAGGNRYRFLPGGKALALMQGYIRHQDFWLLDLATGQLRQLTNLRPGFDIRSFDVTPDGKQILFDRFRENSDVVLIDLPPR
ncbi:MAG: protein kinase [Acidobacteria bacterium]|nr:protein kinase [Acidobacteriota bacterium]MCA1610252.1 protein kinase [Acidobacteriota bacterium]